MANYYSFVILNLLTTILTLISATSSTPRRALVTPSSDQPRATTTTGFRVRLSHVDNNNRNLTKLERLAGRVSRGTARLHRLKANDVKTPVRAGNGEFLMKLSIGTPAKEFSAIMDTGSDLVWTQCLPCTGCFDQDTPIFDPAGSSSFSKLPCKSSLCEALSSSNCGEDNDSDNKCEYFYAYGDDSTTEGFLATETFSFGDQSSSSNVSVVQGVGFGCGGENHGAGFGQAAGLVGLGRGPLSLVSQLQEPRFSYCMTSIDQSSDSTLIMGSLEKNGMLSSSSGEVRTTGLVRNPAQPSFYYLELQDITVGATRLGLGKDAFALNEDGSGGMIIDSGTTITYLERQGFDAVRKELVRQMSELEVDDSGSQGLDLCFKLPRNNDNRIEVPRMVFHFKDADLELPAENYMIGDSGVGVVCLAMGPSSGLSILGNVQQQNMLVVHDLQDETVSFVPTQCDKL